MPLSHVELHTSGDLQLAPLAAAFPSLGFVRCSRARAGAIDGTAWRDDAFDFWRFDRALDHLAAIDAPLAITVADDATAIAQEILTRAQRVAPRRNAASESAWFTRMLGLHRTMHDLDKPLVRTDYDHAIDCWQWTLRLDPRAAGEIQLAALCHGLERLESEPDVRIEPHAPDYAAFKGAHAAHSAGCAAALFTLAGVPAEIAERAVIAIERHERAIDDPVTDADALSFFSFNSASYLRYFGPDQTARKVDSTYRRMSERARAELPRLRLLSLIAAQIDELEGTPCAS